MGYPFFYTINIRMKEEREYESTSGQKCSRSIVGVVLLRTKKSGFAILTMEHYIDDLNMLKDVRTVAVELEKQQAFSLLAPMKWFDMRAADRIEELLKGH